MKLIALDANTLQSLGDRPEAITTRDISLQIAVASKKVLHWIRK